MCQPRDLSGLPGMSQPRGRKPQPERPEWRRASPDEQKAMLDRFLVEGDDSAGAFVYQCLAEELLAFAEDLCRKWNRPGLGWDLVHESWAQFLTDLNDPPKQRRIAEDYERDGVDAVRKRLTWYCYRANYNAWRHDKVFRQNVSPRIATTIGRGDGPSRAEIEERISLFLEKIHRLDDGKARDYAILIMNDVKPADAKRDLNITSAGYRKIRVLLRQVARSCGLEPIDKSHSM